MRKNPDNQPLRIVQGNTAGSSSTYPIVLALLAIAESNLVRAGKDSAMPHFIALIKALEKFYSFKFEQIEDNNEN